MYYVYILNCNDNHTYVGCTSNLKERLNRHQKGHVLATKSRLPVDLKFSIEHYPQASNMYKSTQIIAEVKTQSPFGFTSKKSWDELFTIANEIGDIISIHTDPRWGGSFDLINKAKSLTDKPILAKGIHSTDDEIEQAIKAGADYVLVVGRIPAIFVDKCLIEPLNLNELKVIPENLKIVWNSRDLSNGSMKKETFGEARKIFKGWLCQASNIKTINDIKEGAEAVLVGANLLEFRESLI